MLEALRLLRQRGLQEAMRVPVEQIADDLELVVHYKPLPRLEGSYVRQSGAPSGVLVNNRLPWPKQRFTLAHEIGHHRFGHDSSLDLEVGTFDPALNDQEKVAESFAAWLLMPRQAVMQYTAARPITSPVDAYGLALRLGVSYQAACLHLRNLRLVTESDARSWFSVPPKSLKQELLNSAIGIGWADVHVLDARDDGSEIHVSPGDVVLLGAIDEVDLSGRGNDLMRIVTADGMVRLEAEAAAMVNPATACPSFGLAVASHDGDYEVSMVLEPKRQGVHTRWFGK